MEAAASPARLYASLVGAVLFTVGILGFFENLSWLNFLHVGTGALALLLAGCAPRLCALGLGLAYIALGVWGHAGGEAWQWLHIALGLLGLAALAGSEPRAQAAAKRL